MAASIKIDRDNAKALLVELGLKTAKRYSDAKLLGMLTKLDATDDTAEPGKHAKLYERIIKANQAEKDLVLTGKGSGAGEEEAPKSSKAKPKKGKKAPVQEEEYEEEEDDEEEYEEEDDEEEEEPAPKKSKKKAAGKSSKAKKAGTGVRQTDEQGRTAKDRVYLEWLEQGGKDLGAEDTDYDGIAEAADASDKAPSTIRGWISAWRFDKGLPRIAARMAAEEEAAPKPKKGKKGKKKK